MITDNFGHRARIALAGATVALLALSLGAVATSANAAVILPVPTLPKPAVKATVVSLTFDDSNADQLTALSTLEANGLHGTFYTITGSIGEPNYLTLANLHTIYSAGNEIGGHTVNHPDLTLETAAEAQRQVCDARNQLTTWGFPQTSFAYPYAAENASVQAIVKQCGYNSARNLGDVFTQEGGTAGLYAETIPPANAYALRAPDEVDSTWTLANLESTVTNAEAHGGGWDILTFHHICEPGSVNCDPTVSITPELFAQFAAWLSAHIKTTLTTSVKTVTQVIGGTVKAPVTAPAPPAVAGAITNSSLETAVTPGVPSCWSAYDYGTNTPTYAETTNAHTGTVAEMITMSGYSSGDSKLMPTFDTGGCSPGATAGHSYQLGAWYESTGNTQFAVYYRNATGGFDYWTSSPYFPPSATYSHAVWTTPPLPAGYTGISFGLNIVANGTLTTDDYSDVDAATLPPPPTAMQNASLETAGNAGLPQCWTNYGYGTNTAGFAETTPGHTGSVAETITMSSYTDGDAMLLPTLDTSSCAPAATAGTTYNIGAWYESSTVTQFALYYRSAAGIWTYWTSSPWLAASSTWTQATWTTPAVPAGATAISFGLSLFSLGTLTTDDYSLAPAS